jgi:hypothetical protein
MRAALAGLLLATGFYLMTAIVYAEEPFGVQLVLKPYPSLVLLARGGEEVWRREHTGEPEPWYLTGNFVPLIDDDWEGGHPLWEEVYVHGFLGVLLGWPALGVACLWRRLRRTRSAREGQLP